MPTWYKQRTLEALFFGFCIQFINRGSQWCCKKQRWSLFWGMVCYYYRWRLFKAKCSFRCSSSPVNWYVLGLYLEACYYGRWRFCRLNILSGVPPLLLTNMLLATRDLSTWFIHVPLATCPHWWFLFFALTWVHPSCTFLSPLSGCFVFLELAKFSSFSALFWR